jgi:RecB family exonuclease
MKPSIEPEVPYLSCSRIKTFLQCPRKYALQYVDKIPPEYRSASLAFGTAWHHAVGHFLMATVPETLDELTEIFRAALEDELMSDGAPVLFDDGESDTDALVTKAREMLEVFMRDFPRPDRVLSIEEPFLLELRHPATGKSLGVPLVGAMDALVDRAGKVKVVELKSAKRRWSADQLDQDIQGTAYRMAARSMGFDAAEVELAVTTETKTPEMQVESLVRHARDEVELVELAFDVVKGVRAGVSFRNRGWACRGCSHAGACSR